MVHYNPSFWSPAARVRGPMLWVAGEEDALIGEEAMRGSAAYYEADYSSWRERGTT